MAAHLGGVHVAVGLCQAQRKERAGHHLGRVGLGGAHADLWARLHIEDAVGLARSGGAQHVGHGEDLAAQPLHAARRRKSIRSLAGLRDDHAERVLGDEDVLLVVELGGILADNRDVRPGLDESSGNEAHVVGGATSDDEDAVHGREVLLTHAKLVEKDALLAQTTLEQALDGFGLLGNLLLHEVGVAAERCCGGVPVDVKGAGVLHRCALGVVDGDLARLLEQRDLAVLELDHVGRHACERRDVGGGVGAIGRGGHHER